MPLCLRRVDERLVSELVGVLYPLGNVQPRLQLILVIGGVRRRACR